MQPRPRAHSGDSCKGVLLCPGHLALLASEWANDEAIAVALASPHPIQMMSQCEGPCHRTFMRPNLAQVYPQVLFSDAI